MVRADRLAAVDLVFLLAVVPAVEELYFRGLLLEHLRDSFGAAVAVVLGGALFGALHWPAGLHLPMTLFGIGLGAVALSSRCLLLPVALHASWNALALVWAMPAGATRWLPVAWFVGVASLILVVGIVARRIGGRAVCSAGPGGL